ncbi:MAG: hypothetical protein DWP94_03665 [Flavobacterium sp.]|nr:MAG: hypothetical protein DWP94_03665 [Flavobacterium sp.]
MDTSLTEIFPHDTETDVMHKINFMELTNWINHLKYIKRELNNLIGLSEEGRRQEIEYVRINKKFQKKSIENDRLLQTLQYYLNSRRNINECEDMQCDMAYVHEHESFRRRYLYHLEKYRGLKDEFFYKERSNLIAQKPTS